MLDPSILMKLEMPMPPEMPVAAIQREWRSDEGDTVAWVGRRYADAFDSYANQWAADLEQVRAMRQAHAEALRQEPGQIPHLDNLIANYEAVAEMRAKWMNSAEKDIRRTVKAAFRRDPAVAAAIRETGARMVATDKRIQEGVLDYALFLRAVRSEFDPDSRGGPVFDNAEDLGRHLDALIAA